MWGNIIKKRLISFAFDKTSHITCSHELVPVLYQGFEYGLFIFALFSNSHNDAFPFTAFKV